MALAEHREGRGERRSGQTSRQRPVVWPKPSELRQSAPILRLRAEIWAIPEVSRIGLSLDGSGVQVWVLMPDDDRGAEARVWVAERAYLDATPLHSFELRIIPLSRVREEALPPFETVLER